MGNQLIDHLQRSVCNCQILFCFLTNPLLQRRNNAKVDIHRLEILDSLIADVQAQSADGRCLDYAYILFYAEKSDANELKTLIDNTLSDFKPDKEKFDQLKRRFVGEFFNEFSDLEGFNITFLRNILDNSNMFEVYDIIHKITYDEMLDIFDDVDFSNFSLVTLDANIVE